MPVGSNGSAQTERLARRSRVVFDARVVLGGADAFVFGWLGYFSGDGLTPFGKIAAFAVLATLTAGFLFFTFKIVEWFLFSALSEVTIDRKTGWWSFRYLLFSRSKRLRPEAVVVKESGNADDCVWHASIRFKETSKEVPLAFGDGRTVDGFVRELETQFGRLLQEFELEIVFAD